MSNQTKCPFTVLSALFLFFRALPFDSRLFPATVHYFLHCNYYSSARISLLNDLNYVEKTLLIYQTFL